jgi:hypothetical protein
MPTMAHLPACKHPTSTTMAKPNAIRLSRSPTTRLLAPARPVPTHPFKPCTHASHACTQARCAFAHSRRRLRARCRQIENLHAPVHSNACQAEEPERDERRPSLMSVFDSVVPTPELSFSESLYTPSNHPDMREQSAPSLSSPVCIRCGGRHTERDCDTNLAAGPITYANVKPNQVVPVEADASTALDAERMLRHVT